MIELKNYSTNSKEYGFLTIDEIVNSESANLHKVAAITDDTTLFSSIEFIDKCNEKNIKGENLEIKGHEFHYSEITENNEINKNNKENFYNISKNDGRKWYCGYKKKSALAGYPHISFFSNIEFFKYLVERL